MKVIGIIPARFGSTRFPGKPLTLIHGKTMIERVYRRAEQASSLSRIIVATDDKRIFDHVTGFGGEVIMTDEKHPSGTDRCAEVISQVPDAELVVNIQGDEPYIHPGQIDLLVNCLADSGASIATLVKKVTDIADLENVNIPKVVVAQNGNALYFSRSLVPYTKPENRQQAVSNGLYYKHIGIYGYRAIDLPRLAALPKGKMEVLESLEQLRWLEHGFSIRVAVTEHDNVAIDVPGDVGVVESRFSAD